MMAKILLLTGRQAHPIESSRFDQEAALEGYLEQFPDLIPLDLAGNPPPNICIGRQVTAGSGAIDLLFMDTTGLVTIVEAKLAKNPELRRKVIGQIVEYASIVCQWSAERLEQKANEYLRRKGSPGDLYSALVSLSPHPPGDGPPLPPLSKEALQSRISSNLGKGIIRLIIAVDELVEPLLATVKFLNASSKFDLSVLQVREFQLQGNQRILIPYLFTDPAKPTSPAQWDLDGFLQQSSQRPDDEFRVLKKLIDFAESEQATLWGRGANIASFQFVIHAVGVDKQFPAYFVMANGKMSFDFWTLGKRLGASAVIDRYRGNLAQAGDIPRESIETSTWKEFNVSVLASPQSWEAFTQAVKTLKSQLQKGDGLKAQ